ncbi:hypothetical protein [Aeromonas rivipollensis]|uniref:hypothetical protein n=1 Tax=Aeromonas rivipollensis TaxID=948519 RepID=UPI003D22F6E3
MSLTIKSDGNLKQLGKNLEKLSGTIQLTMAELMPASFISNCSKFSSIDELFEASGFVIESEDDFAAIPDNEWDFFIQQNTTYENWLEMQQSAVSEYAKAALYKGIR